MVIYTSALDICNEALDRLGCARITSVADPQTKVEVLVNAKYDECRRALLRQGVWNFAVDFASLASDPTAEYSSFSAVFNLPNDFIRFIGLPSLFITTADSDQYDIFGGKLGLVYYNTTPVTLQYVKDVVEVVKFSPMFKQVFVLHLAYILAYGLTQKMSLVKTLYAEYLDVLATAKAVDGQDRPPRRVTRSSWKDARQQYGSERTYMYPRYFEE
jgi:hypothetical protein